MTLVAAALPCRRLDREPGGSHRRFFISRGVLLGGDKDIVNIAVLKNVFGISYLQLFLTSSTTSDIRHFLVAFDHHLTHELLPKFIPLTCCRHYPSIAKLLRTLYLGTLNSS